MRMLLAICVGVFTLAGCDEEPPQISDPVRAIKTYTVSAMSEGPVRRYSGIVAASDTANLSFQVPGNIAEILVTLGDVVQEGQVLARLDDERFTLELEAAEADLGRARAEFEQMRLNLERQRTLFAKDWVSRAALDQAETSFQSAQSAVEYALSRVNLARRNLNNTVLRAPFDGSISERTVEPFTEIRAGQKIFGINARGALEVEFNVPETEISFIVLGSAAQVAITSTDPLGIAREPQRSQARITEIGSAAGQANAFPVSAVLLGADNVRPGMSADINVRLATPGDRSGGYLLPLEAIIPGSPEKAPEVYVFDANTGTVVRRSIRIGGIQDSWLIAVDGLEIGDRIAVAGVSFLKTGQEVRLLADAGAN